MDGGIDDVGLGVLFGLEMYKYEFAGLLMHAEHLEAVHGVGPHTISVPRIKRADDIDPDVFDNGLSDELFAKVIACIRIAVPYTGMIISTRESQQVRERALGLGISQISGAPAPRSAAMRKRSVRTTLSSLMYPISARSTRLFTGSCSWGLFRRSAPPATARAAPATAL